MNASQLLKHFDRLAEAPDAVARLRRFILNLAVRGKLVEQDAGDESAVELLKRLTVGTKKPTKNSSVATKPEPSKCPSGWVFARFADVLTLEYGDNLPAEKRSNSGEFPVYGSNGVVGSHHEAFVHELCIVVGRKGSAGALNLCMSKGSCITDVAYYCVPPIGLDLQYTFKMFHTLGLDILGKGIKPGLSRAEAYELWVPIPPLPEQHRIVAKVDELMALCDQLEAVQQERERRRDRLAAASLQRLNQPAADTTPEEQREHARFHLNHLPLLITRPEHVKAMRRTILDAAIKGKLVPQDVTEESASELLHKIQKRKMHLINQKVLKADKALPPIKSEEMRFVLPTGWIWSRLGNLAHLVTSGSRDWAKYYADEGPIFVRMGNLSRDSYQLRLKNIQRVAPPKGGEGKRTSLEAGDLLISITGEVGLLGLIPSNFGEAYINQHTCMVRPAPELVNRYLPELFRSTFAQDQFNAPQRGLKNSFRLTDVTEFLVPLPPLAEQHRIVAKVDELMALCDRLEAQLTITQTDSRRLLEAVLDEILGIVRTPEYSKAIASPRSILDSDPQIGKASRFMTTNPAMTIDQLIECIDDLGGSASPSRLLKQTGLGEDVETFYDLLRAARDSGKVMARLGVGEIIRRHTDED
jgi:type I restriction enzyme, S subunit